MTEHADRPVRGYSKGMRQRIKLAQALVHDPHGAVPRRAADRHRPGRPPRADGPHHRTGAVRAGACWFPAMCFHEVQAVTRQIVLLNRGRLVALGDVRQIRDLIDTHPHRIVLRCLDSPALAAKLVRCDDVVGVELKRRRWSDRGRDPRARTGSTAGWSELALEADTPIEEVYSDDDNLEAVFKYLVNS